MNHENTHSGEEYDSLEESTAWAVGDSGTVLQTDDRGQTWREITNDVISSLGTNSLKNGRRLTEVSLRAVAHHKLDKQVQILSGGTTVARMVMVVGDYHSILRYDPPITLAYITLTYHPHLAPSPVTLTYQVRPVRHRERGRLLRAVVQVDRHVNVVL